MAGCLAREMASVEGSPRGTAGRDPLACASTEERTRAAPTHWTEGAVITEAKGGALDSHRLDY